jgi:D-threonate/D-erythronate kinase
MTIKVAVIADDLTGALDSSTPFALAGLRVAVATRPAGVMAALALVPEVIVANSATRADPPAAAAEVVMRIALQLAEITPEIVFKKIDSRLKGNVLAETEVTAAAFGLGAMVVAPAVPDQGRLTVGGNVTGRGVVEPLAIAPFVPAAAHVADASQQSELDALVAATDWRHTLAVGARGLGTALAGRLGRPKPEQFTPDSQTLFAIGSHDPITATQIERLSATVTLHDAPLGEVGQPPARLPAVLVSTGDYVGPDAALSERFAQGVARTIERLAPHTLVLSGGDTALAVLDALGVSLVFPQGEAAPGLPWFLIERENHPSIRCIVKSGGFGGTNVLADLLVS